MRRFVLLVAFIAIWINCFGQFQSKMNFVSEPKKHSGFNFMTVSLISFGSWTALQVMAKDKNDPALNVAPYLFGIGAITFSTHIIVEEVRHKPKDL